MLKKLNQSNVRDLYQYFIGLGNDIPFYFPVEYEIWYKCMFSDCTEDDLQLFNELETYLYYENDILKGFIQFGLSNFVFTENGKDFSNHYAIIRNIHYSKDSKSPEELIEIALQFFENGKIDEISAFFHYFGMSCYARHGKLFESCFYIVDLLQKYSFMKGHENVYFSKNIKDGEFIFDQKIIFKMSDIDKTKKKITFVFDNIEIGYCEIIFLQNNICYLTMIEIYSDYRRQGFGTKCLNNLLHILKEKNIQKLDLDTIDTNYIAQDLYIKNGFSRKGITRSYYRE